MYLAVDNPTNVPLTISVDTLAIEVPARSMVWREIEKGEHSVTFQDDSVVTCNFQEDTCLLNPSLTEYLMYEAIYTNIELKALYPGDLPEQTIRYCGIEAQGHYVILKDLVNPVTWDYGPREMLPLTAYGSLKSPARVYVKIADPLEAIDKLTFFPTDVRADTKKRLVDSLSVIYQ